MEERQSMTKDPLSDDVTKYKTIPANDITDRKPPGKSMKLRELGRVKLNCKLVDFMIKN